MRKNKLLFGSLLGTVSTIGAIVPLTTVVSCSQAEDSAVLTTIDTTGFTFVNPAKTVKKGTQKIELKYVLESGYEITNIHVKYGSTTVLESEMELSSSTLTIKKEVTTTDPITVVVETTAEEEGPTVTAAERLYLAAVNATLTGKANIISTSKALETLKASGYDVINYHLSDSRCEFAFDIYAQKFIIMAGDDIIAAPTGYEMTSTYRIFKFTDDYTTANKKYSWYLLDDYSWGKDTDEFVCTTGVDFGNNKQIKNVKYTADSTAKTVILNTFCEVLNITGGSDTIYHMGTANDIWVNYSSSTNAATTTFNEAGKVGYLYIDNATVNFLTVDAKDKSAVDILEVGKGVVKGDSWVSGSDE